MRAGRATSASCWRTTGSKVAPSNAVSRIVPTSSAAGCGSGTTTGSREFLSLQRRPTQAVYETLATIERKAAYLEHFFLFRRDALMAVGGVDETIGSTGADDFDLIWTMLEHGATVAVIPDLLYNYRDHHGERLSLRPADLQRRDLARILDKHGVRGDARERMLREHAVWFGAPVHVVEAGLRAARSARRRDDTVARVRRESRKPHSRATRGPRGCSRHQSPCIVAISPRRVSPAVLGRSRAQGSLPRDDAAGRDGVAPCERLSRRGTRRPRRRVAIRSAARGMAARAGGGGRLRWARARSARRACCSVAFIAWARRGRITDARFNHAGSTNRSTSARSWRPGATPAAAQEAVALARRSAPATADWGLCHGDFCAENLLVVPALGLHVVDNETICELWQDYDLARTWYRWPMEALAFAAFLDGYREHRQADTFLAHFQFWAICALLRSAAFRLREGVSAEVPIRRLEALLKSPAPSPSWGPQ